jgi:gamma-glutamyltranspeptidase
VEEVRMTVTQTVLREFESDLVVSGVEQNREMTRFAFEPGCRLRMRIAKPQGGVNGGR